MKKLKCVSSHTGSFIVGKEYRFDRRYNSLFIVDECGYTTYARRTFTGSYRADGEYTDAKFVMVDSGLSDHENRKRRDQKHEIIILLMAGILFSLYMLWTR